MDSDTPSRTRRAASEAFAHATWRPAEFDLLWNRLTALERAFLTVLFSRSYTFADSFVCAAFRKDRNCSVTAWNRLKYRLEEEFRLIYRRRPTLRGHRAGGWILSNLGKAIMTSRAGTDDDETLLDDLTRIPRRGAFDRDLPAMTQEAQRRMEPLGLVMVDIDHFKRVNDKHGHPVGDEILRGVSQTLAQVVRGRGQCYRYGGEEMALLLPNHSVEEATAVAERARRAIERTPMGLPRVEVTASFGVASYPEHATDAAVLVKRADEALYDAKNRGRNLVRMSGEPPPAQAGPREVPKRAPEPGGLTSEQRTKIRSDYIRDGIAFCPRDGAPLEILEDRQMDHALGVIAHCPDCGLSMHEPGPLVS